jgi:hypothetical protein
MILLAILLPWLSFLVRGKIFAGILCLILQCTIIGWLPAAIWAVMSRNQAVTNDKLNEIQKSVSRNQTPHKGEDILSKIEKLGKLKEQGHISEEEFQEQKKKILV